jgi:hypothetical protein
MNNDFQKSLGLLILFLVFFLPLHAFPRATGAPLQPQDSGNEAIGRLYRHIEHSAPVDRPSLTGREMQVLYDYVALHRVTCESALKKYDPQGIMGFCFGRAMALHLAARRMGLSPEGVRKLFIIGKLGAGGVTEWRFHVAALVRGDDGEWHALEYNIARAPCTIKEWIRAMRSQWDLERRARLYVVTPLAVIPCLRDFPDESRESGKNIIEISFNPLTRKGFTASHEAGSTVYWLGNHAVQEYFDCTGDGGGRAFDFRKVIINGEAYDYNDYFADLLKSLNNEAQERFRPQILKSAE